MKGLLRLFTQGDSCVLLSETSGKHVEKYQHFREFLRNNRNALRQLAEMEMLYYSGQSFTAADIGYQYENLFAYVRDLVRSLNALADDRFVALNLKAAEVNASITSILKPVITREPLALVIPLKEISSAAAGSVGGKAANLAHIGKQTDLNIPTGFVVTATGYDLFLRANRIDQMVLDELAGISPGDSRLEEVSHRLTNLILAAHVPDELVALLHAHYDAIEQQTRPDIRLAMRSSAVREDSDASFAGQYRSVLNVARERLVDAYKEVVASSFSPRAIAYRQMAGIDITETPMCVLGLAMIDAAASGVLYTADPSGNDAETMQISAVLGLGEQLVSGTAAADTFMVDRSTGSLRRQEIVAKQFRLDAVTEGTAEHQVPWLEAQEAALSEQEAKQLASAGVLLEQLFAGPQDIEWVIDNSRRIFILQCRPLQVISKAHELLPEPSDAVLLMKAGTSASHGVVAGPVYVVSGQEPLTSIPDHAVLVTKTASPRYAEVMGRINGLIAEVGSTTCHLASVAREFGVPMAVNVTDATRMLASGHLITLYAQGEPAIYQGIIEKDQQTVGPAKKRIMESSVHQKMRSVLDLLSPLHLTNPDDPSFQPDNCSSLHDIIRFAHEQAIREMFNLSALAEEQSVAVKLSTHIPLTLHLIDLGGGLKPGLTTCNTVTAEHFTSEPIKALWRGFTHPGINWSGTVQFDGSSFLSRMAASATSEFGPEPGGDSYALIGTDYLNFSAKFGYHFATLDTFCGDDPDHNYLSLQFSGGAGTFFGKTLRLQFLGKVLGALGCAVTLRGDLLEASLNRFARTEMLEQLDQIGRLLASSRLLDMAIANQEDVDGLTAEFMHGNYDLLNHKRTPPLKSFYTHLGHWRQIEDAGTACILSDGSPWMSSLSSGVFGMITKTFGRSYQEFLDTIGAYYYFPLAIAKCGAVGNARLSLAVKAVQGTIDQAGGLVFGLRDIGNYFVFRINALEDNVMLFEFVNNKRLERARVNIAITRGQWHTLHVVVQENQASCRINDVHAFAYQAERPLHGHIGLWTKADSVTLFNDLMVDDGVVRICQG